MVNRAGDLPMSALTGTPGQPAASTAVVWADGVVHVFSRGSAGCAALPINPNNNRSRCGRNGVDFGVTVERLRFMQVLQEQQLSNNQPG